MLILLSLFVQRKYRRPDSYRDWMRTFFCLEHVVGQKRRWATEFIRTLSVEMKQDGTNSFCQTPDAEGGSQN